MPIYEVTDNFGNTLELEGDSPPTEAELEEIFAQFSPVEAPQQVDTELTPVVAEAAGALNRGFAAIPDFFIDAANAVLPDDIDAVAGGNLLFRQFLNQNEGQIPRVEDALESQAPTRNFMEPGLPRTVVQEGGEFLPGAATGLRAGVPTVQQVTQRLTDDAARSAAVTAGRLRVGDRRAAEQAISASGRAIDDPKGIEAVNAGVDAKTVGVVKAASDKTRSRMREMVEIADLRLNRGAQSQRTGNIVGDAVGERLQGILKVNKKAGKAISDEAKKLSGKPINTNPTLQNFIDDLIDKGVTFSDDLNPTLRDSSFEDFRESGVEDLINLVTRRLKSANGDAGKAHTLKKLIDSRVKTAKLSEGGLDGDLERILFSVRRNLDDTLDAAYPTYKKQNDIFRETRQVLDEFEKVTPSDLDLDAPSANKQIGRAARQIFGQAARGGPLEDSLAAIDNVAAKYGINTSDNITQLVDFSESLDALFKISPRTGFKSQVGQAATEAVLGEKVQASKTLLRSAKEFIRGPEDERALKAIKDLLE